jgi:hypothetical protein
MEKNVVLTNAPSMKSCLKMEHVWHAMLGSKEKVTNVDLESVPVINDSLLQVPASIAMSIRHEQQMEGPAT